MNILNNRAFSIHQTQRINTGAGRAGQESVNESTTGPSTNYSRRQQGTASPAGRRTFFGQRAKSIGMQQKRAPLEGVSKGQHGLDAVEDLLADADYGRLGNMERRVRKTEIMNHEVLKGVASKIYTHASIHGSPVKKREETFGLKYFAEKYYNQPKEEQRSSVWRGDAGEQVGTPGALVLERSQIKKIVTARMTTAATMEHRVDPSIVTSSRTRGGQIMNGYPHKLQPLSALHQTSESRTTEDGLAPFTPSIHGTTRFTSVARARPRLQPNYFAPDTFSTLQQPSDLRAANKLVDHQARGRSIDKLGQKTLSPGNHCNNDYITFQMDNSPAKAPAFPSTAKTQRQHNSFSTYTVADDVQGSFSPKHLSTPHTERQGAARGQQEQPAALDAIHENTFSESFKIRSGDLPSGEGFIRIHDNGRSGDSIYSMDPAERTALQENQMAKLRTRRINSIAFNLSKIKQTAQSNIGRKVERSNDELNYELMNGCTDESMFNMQLFETSADLEAPTERKIASPRDAEPKELYAAFDQNEESSRPDQGQEPDPKKADKKKQREMMKALFRRLEDAEQQRQQNQGAVRQYSDYLLQTQFQKEIQEFDYDQLKQQMNVFKGDLCKKTFDSTKFKTNIREAYQTEEDVLRAQEIFKRHREEPNLSIKFKKYEGAKVNDYWKTREIKKLAELAKEKDQAFSHQMEQLCACGDQETLRDFLQGIFVERQAQNEAAAGREQVRAQEQIRSELSACIREAMARPAKKKTAHEQTVQSKATYVKDCLTNRGSQATGKRQDAVGFDDVKAKLQATNSQQLRMLVVKQLAALREDDSAKLDIKTVYSLLQLSKSMDILFSRYTLGDFYENWDSPFAAAERIQSRAGADVDKLERVWRKKHQVEYQTQPEAQKQSTLGATENKLQGLSLPQALTKTVDVNEFYQEAKHGKPVTGSRVAVATRYNHTCHSKREVPIPSFADIEDHVLFLAEQRLGGGQVEALRDFLVYFSQNETKYIGPPKELKLSKHVVQELTIDHCAMSDDSFASILDGVLQQKALRSLSYLNNPFGAKSLAKFRQLLDCASFGVFLRCFQLVNPTGGLSRSIGEDLMEAIRESRTLVKVKLSHLDWCEGAVAPHLEALFAGSSPLSQLDLSASGLSTKTMAGLLEGLCSNPAQLTSLNLGYNPVVDDSRQFAQEQARTAAKKGKKTEPESSTIQAFMTSFTTYLEECPSLTHLNISGMAFSQQQILEVCQAAAKSPVLMSIHMSDLHITDRMQCERRMTTDQGAPTAQLKPNDPLPPEPLLRLGNEFALEVLDVFGIHESRLSNPLEPEVNKRVGNAGKIREAVQRLNRPLDPEMMQNEDKVVDLVDYKDRLIKSHQRRGLARSIRQGAGACSRGIGRQPENQLDTFVLTRKMDLPELVFNQNVHSDCYFDALAGSRWQLSEKGECYLCQNRKYVAIYFNPATAPSSKHFIEIENQQTKEFLKGSLNLTTQDQKTRNPIIFGTVTHSWGRKLKMLDAALFSLFSVGERDGTGLDLEQAIKIKEETVTLIDNFDIEQLTLAEATGGPRLDFKSCLRGWHKVLASKILQNSEMDLLGVNFPQFSQKAPRFPGVGAKAGAVTTASDLQLEQNSYIYAELLPAGHHQFVIYDRFTDKFWICDFFLDLNRQEILPLAPHRTKSVNPAAAVRILPNVWRPWIADTSADYAKMLQRDSVRVHEDKGCRYFDLAAILPKLDSQKQMEYAQEVEGAKRVLQHNYEIIFSAFKHIQSQSSAWPQLDLKAILDFLKVPEAKEAQPGASLVDTSAREQQSTSRSPAAREGAEGEADEGASRALSELSHDHAMGKEHVLTRDLVEDAFIQANYSSRSGLGGSLHRAEFLHLLVRLARPCKSPKYATHLQDFINSHLRSSFEHSEIIRIRHHLRSSSTLNLLLAANKAFLTKLFHAKLVDKEHKKQKETFEKEGNLVLVYDTNNTAVTKQAAPARHGFDQKCAALLFVDILEEINKMQTEAYQEEMKEWKQQQEQAEVERQELLKAQEAEKAQMEKEDAEAAEKQVVKVDGGEEAEEVKQPEEPVSSAMRVQRWFCFSQMTVLDEAKRGDDYESLRYAEFLELLCRAAIERSQERAAHGAENEPKQVYHTVHELLLELQAKHDVLADFELAPPAPAREEQQLRDLETIERLASDDVDFAKDHSRKHGLKLVTTLAANLKKQDQ